MSPNRPADPRSKLQEQRPGYEGKKLGGCHRCWKQEERRPSGALPGPIPGSNNVSALTGCTGGTSAGKFLEAHNAEC